MIYAIHKETKKHEIVDYSGESCNVQNCDGFVHYYVEADSDGWIPHDGSGCPLPDKHPCDVKHRDGEVFQSTFIGDSCAKDWTHISEDGDIGDIIAYRPILNPHGFVKDSSNDPQERFENIISQNETLSENMASAMDTIAQQDDYIKILEKFISDVLKEKSGD